MKSSVVRNMRQTLTDRYPGITEHLDDIIPKKSQLTLIKCKDATTFVTLDGEMLFFNSFDGPWMPSLRLLHKYPNMLTKVQVDKGAIKFVMNGADIMCPGLTSKGGILNDDIKEGTIVAVMAEGKEHAVAIGIMKMDAVTIKKENRGIGIENIHHLNDVVWKQSEF
ncbi:hypothetical protein MP638_000126 [Amoeboaphelidium occidentale]|nr:hypothetical protein MP638_000126 [Amoeboaphelidium occidentale]